MATSAGKKFLVDKCAKIEISLAHYGVCTRRMRNKCARCHYYDSYVDESITPTGGQ